MPGIGEEFTVFVLAMMAGGIVRLVYKCITCLRQIVRHSLLVISVEDFFFWTGAALYIFVQIYHTSDGSIRWYFVLGVVVGAILSSVIIRGLEKLSEKILSKKS